jgi:hypothetical protein
MTEPAPPSPLVMLGAPDAAVCEDDSCLLPGAVASADTQGTDDDATAPPPRTESSERA